jgi:hypothetical protein
MRPERARRIGDALAYLAGDVRDEPLCCAWCRSEKVDRDLRGRDVLNCQDCYRETSMEFAADDRHRRMRKRAQGGIGDLVDLLRDKDKEEEEEES